MNEKLHTIPVNEAFEVDSECPLCVMRKTLEEKAIDFTMGPSCMDDDVREATSRMGFCEKHLEQLYKNQNRLGLALILQSHMDKIIKDIEKYSGSNSKITVPSFFKKKGDKSEIVEYLEGLETSCYVCDKINGPFERYVATVFYLYQHETSFHQKFKGSKGFCTNHYKTLYMAAPSHLSGEELKDFLQELNTIYLENMRRVREDLEWFINKFDYRYADEPWKNAKDALPRSMMKTDSIT